MTPRAVIGMAGWVYPPWRGTFYPTGLRQADELAHADWFTRDDLRRRLEAGEIGLPNESSIAYRLIHAWLDGKAPL